MPTPAERKALLFIAAVTFLGASVRTVKTLSGAPPADEQSRVALASQITQVQQARSAAAKQPVKKGVTQKGRALPVIDVDKATVAQLQTLPRVGPVLAQRIKAHRDSAGPFGSLEELDKVKGIGPAMLTSLAPRVTFSGTRRP